MHTARLRSRPLAGPLKADYGKRLMRRREMNTQGKSANFSPCREESNAKQNTQNYCRGPAHDCDGGQHRRGPQQSKTAIERGDVLWHAAANMPRQSRLSRRKTVANSSHYANFSPLEKSNGQENSQSYCLERANDWGSGEHRRGPQQIKTAIKRSDVLRCAGANMPRQPRMSRNKEVASAKRAL